MLLKTNIILQPLTLFKEGIYVYHKEYGLGFIYSCKKDKYKACFSTSKYFERSLPKPLSRIFDVKYNELFMICLSYKESIEDKEKIVKITETQWYSIIEKNLIDKEIKNNTSLIYEVLGNKSYRNGCTYHTMIFDEKPDTETIESTFLDWAEHVDSAGWNYGFNLSFDNPEQVIKLIPEDKVFSLNDAIKLAYEAYSHAAYQFEEGTIKSGSWSNFEDWWKDNHENFLTKF